MVCEPAVDIEFRSRNPRPRWLADARAALDAAVADAYCWPAGISDADALRRLPALNPTGA